MCIRDSFKPVCEKIGFDAFENNFKINNFYNKNSKNETEFQADWENLDCEHGRILTAKGVYTCPFLANDHRGRSGACLLYTSRCV